MPKPKENAAAKNDEATISNTFFLIDMPDTIDTIAPTVDNAKNASNIEKGKALIEVLKIKNGVTGNKTPIKYAIAVKKPDLIS